MRDRTQLMGLLAIGLGVGLGCLAASGQWQLLARVWGQAPAKAAAGNRLASAEEKADQDRLDRTVLPIPELKPALVTELDVRKAKAPLRYPNSVAPLAEMLRLNGYSTAFGKLHETARGRRMGWQPPG
jgi:hypothetical protein